MLAVWRFFGCVVLAGTAVLRAGAAQAASCTVTPSAMAFGAYDALSAAPTLGAAPLLVQCQYTNFFELIFGFSVSFQVALSAGASGNVANRLMQGGPDRLFYNLFTDATRTVVWGDGSAGSATQAGQITVPGFQGSGQQSFTVFGRIPALQNVAAGSYQDTITVTVNY
ncbi:MAG: spore coat protein U domain-containing protein [Gammaproteobacteria bacterium]|nr:spore coat protein U domain-containing protein [Gammaproteobacteria bacterium]